MRAQVRQTSIERKVRAPELTNMLYTRYPIVARTLGLAAAECIARAKVSCIQSINLRLQNLRDFKFRSVENMTIECRVI